MSMTFATNQVGANSDYMTYVSGPITKTDKVNSPDLLDFSLINYDGNMVKLVRGTHIVLTTATYGVWYAGYITNDPQPVFLGTSKGIPQWLYTYEATGEEYMLNLKPFGIMAPFTNTTQGAIIKALIQHLTPVGVTFDTSGVQNGQLVPRFIVDPNQHFTEVVDAFAKAANFQFRCQNFVATYSQMDSVTAPISVDGNSKYFTPSALQMQTSGDPIINDSIILGAIEPQNYMEEYFMGDGATATFPLISAVYGLDSTLLLDDDFSSSTIDDTKWTIYDTSAAYLQPYGGTLNVLGGNNDGTLDVYLQSQSLIPLEGNLSCVHGEWDFISACDGVLGGLWTGQTSGSYAGLIFGIRATPSGVGSLGTTLNPIIGSVVDTTQSVPINYNLRYVMRTLYTFGEVKRSLPTVSYRDSSGVVHQVNVAPQQAHFYATTIITELDPITAVMTNQWTWNSDLGVVSSLYAYYVPVASNNLNLTVCSVTISVTLQAGLTTLPSGTTSWVKKIIGPNQIDCLDGLAPAATIVDSNNGTTTRSSLLGSATYNPGQATLTYFKETAQLISYLPQAGDLIHLSYRGAGAAVGRAQSKASIAAESSGWGDDGIRSETKRDLTPLPMTSTECQMMAVARVNDNCYQHWTGTYTMPSGPWFSGEPRSGSILPFVNLPSQFPSTIQAEGITEVTSTLVAQSPSEVFTHAISFGPISTEENLLAAIKNTNDVFTPQDTAEIPQFIDVTSLGQTSVVNVPPFLYSGKSSSNWTFTFNDALPSSIAGVEIRYTDNTWGADSGNNLISRIANTATSFTIPRTVRGKVAFLRCYDQRNVCIWSEDITKHTTRSSGITTALVRAQGPSNNYQMIGSILSTTSGASLTPTLGVSSPGGAYATFTLSLKGPVGDQIQVGFTGNLTTVTCTGRWQRVSVTQPTSGTWVPQIIPVTLHQGFSITQMSIEFSTQETIYCKTNSTAYGATSQYSTGVHTSLPLIPPSPTATGDFSEIDAPIVYAVLPANLTDVWGVEIRASDNMTVLFKTDLDNATLTTPTSTGDTSLVLQTTAPALSRRAFSYWLYTYNLFGEYSPGYNFTGALNPPSVSNLSVLNSEQMAVWTGNSATAYEFYVDTVDMTLTNLSVQAATINTFYPLAASDFFALRYIAVTPYDALGPGTTVGGFFEYLPDSLAELTSVEMVSA